MDSTTGSETLPEMQVSASNKLTWNHVLVGLLCSLKNLDIIQQIIPVIRIIYFIVSLVCSNKLTLSITSPKNIWNAP